MSTFTKSINILTSTIIHQFNIQETTIQILFDGSLHHLVSKKHNEQGHITVILSKE